MATNKKKIFVTESMSQQGRALLHARDDIELVEFPNMISQPDFQAKLKELCPDVEVIYSNSSNFPT